MHPELKCWALSVKKGRNSFALGGIKTFVPLIMKIRSPCPSGRGNWGHQNPQWIRRYKSCPKYVPLPNIDMIVAGSFCLLLIPVLIGSELPMKRSTRNSFHHSRGLSPQYPLVNNGPFGSENAGATYQRAVTTILNDMMFFIYHFDFNSSSFFFILSHIISLQRNLTWHLLDPFYDILRLFQ